MKTIIAIMREISKLAMFTAIWGFPLWLAKTNDNSNYLWFLILSVTFMVQMFSHYEELERIDKYSQLRKENEQKNVGGEKGEETTYDPTQER